MRQDTALLYELEAAIACPETLLDSSVESLRHDRQLFSYEEMESAKGNENPGGALDLTVLRSLPESEQKAILRDRIQDLVQSFSEDLDWDGEILEKFSDGSLERALSLLTHESKVKARVGKLTADIRERNREQDRGTGAATGTTSPAPAPANTARPSNTSPTAMVPSSPMPSPTAPYAVPAASSAASATARATEPPPPSHTSPSAPGGQPTEASGTGMGIVAKARAVSAEGKETGRVRKTKQSSLQGPVATARGSHTRRWKSGLAEP